MAADTATAVRRAAPAQAPYRRDRMTATAFGVLVGLGLLHAAPGTVLPYLRHDLQLGYGTVSFHMTAFAVGALAAGAVLPAAQRAVGRRRVIVGSALGTAAAAVLLAVAGVVAASLAAATVLGGMLTGAFVGLWSLLSDRHGRWRAVVLSEGEVAVSLGNLSLPLLVGAVAAAGLGWRAGLVAAAALLVGAVAVLARAGVPEAAAASAAPGRAALRGVWMLLALQACLVGFEAGFLTWLPSFLDDVAGLPRDGAVALSSAAFAAMLAGRVITSRLARTVSASRLLTGSLVLVVAGVPILALAPGAATAVAGAVIAGLGTGAFAPLMAALILTAAGAASTRASSAAFVAASLGVLAIPAAMGQIAAAAGLRAAFAAVLALPLLALLVLGRSAARRAGRVRPA
jgi:MFS family permease